MSKKKILILMKTMNIGGAERSLLGLLDSFDYSRYDVDLHINSHEGEFLQYINPSVNIMNENAAYKSLEISIKRTLKTKFFYIGLARLLSRLAFVLFEKLINKKNGSSWIKQQYSSKFTLPFLPKFCNSYDLAINFLGVSDILNIKVNSKLKVGWIHTDYKEICVNKSMDLSVYSKLNYIVNVSDDCNNIFINHYKSLKSKSIVIENILSSFFINNQSVEIDDTDGTISNNINILSIGRFCKAKNFDSIPEVVSNILQKGLQINWYLIGYGSDEELIKDKIKKFNVENNVLILGKKTNPYPYIKACDVYIQPSRFEGKSVTVREAQILNKPVIITNYSTSQSQLTDGYDGFIIPLETRQLSDKLYDLLINKDMLFKVSENTKLEDYTNKNEIKKIYSMLERL